MGESVKKTGMAQVVDKDILKFDDGDGKLHLYVCAAFKGKRWAAQLLFGKDKRMAGELKWQGDFLVSATIKSLLKAKIISEK